MTMAAQFDADADTDGAWDDLAALDADDRLWTALRASPRRFPPVWCRRCGYGRLFGDWRPTKSAHPKACPNCKSAYWDRPGVRATARHPSRQSLATQQRRRDEATMLRRLYRHKAKVRELESALPRRVVAEVSAALDLALLPVPDAPPAPRPPLVTFRRTVPPPPGLEELEGTTPR